MRRDTAISDQDKIFSLIYGHNNVRSKKSKDVDNGTTKGLTGDFAKMWVDPSRNDWTQIDTLVRSFPSNYTVQKGRKAYNNVQSILGVSGFK